MPTQPTEVLDELVKATAEAKEAVRELHRATKEAKHEAKGVDRLVRIAVDDAVEKYVEELDEDVKAMARVEILRVAERLYEDLLAKFGLEKS